MKLKSAAGVVCYVTETEKTVQFYEKLGFVFKTKGDTVATAYLNWYWIEFVAAAGEVKPEFKKDSDSQSKGEGIFLCFSVDDVDEAYNELIANGLTPTEPKTWSWGRREIVVKDPDGYKIVIFKKK